MRITAKRLLSNRSIKSVVRNPAMLDHSRAPLIIAQAPLDETHILRVVYREDNDKTLIITFYPGRITQYGDSK